MKTKSPESDFCKILLGISHRHDIRRVFDGFTRLAACALAAQICEVEYLEETKRWEKPDLDLFANALGALILEMEIKFFEDLIGVYYTEFVLSNKGVQRSGEFHIFKPISDLMVKMVIGNLELFPT